MRHLNVGTQKRTKKKGAITREEMIERDENAKKLAKQHRNTERLVRVSDEPRTWTVPKSNESDSEALTRFRNKHRDLFKAKYGVEIPVRFIK